MAYVLPLMDEEKEKQDQINGSSVVGSTSQSNIIQGGSGAGAGVGTQSAQQQPKRSSTNFTNFSTYLDANKGQGQRMANDRVDNIQEDVNKTKELVNKDTNQFLQGQGVYDGSGKLNTSQFDTKNVQKDFTGTDFTKVGQQDFNKLYNQTSNQFGQFKPSQEKPTYDYLKDPNQVKNQAESFGGRVAELQNEYSGGNNYGRGLQNLDAFLLGQSDIGAKKAQGVQDTINYAKTDKGSGVNAINTAYDQFGNAAKGYDTAIADSNKAYKNAYGSQLANLTNQFQTAEGAIKGLKPKVNVMDVDANGNVIGGAPGQKATQVFTAPNGKKYTVVSDQSQFDQLYNPLQETYGSLSKVAGLTNQKVNPLGDYQKMYKDALTQATKDLEAQYIARNQPVQTLNSQAPSQPKPTVMVGGVPISNQSKSLMENIAPNPITMKKGKLGVDEKGLIPVGSRESVKAVQTAAKAGQGAYNTIEKGVNQVIPVTKKVSTAGVKKLFGGGGGSGSSVKIADDTPQTRDVVSMQNLENAYGGADKIDFNALMKSLNKKPVKKGK